MMAGTALSRGLSLFLLLLASCGESESPSPSVTATEDTPPSAIASDAGTVEATPCGSEKVARFTGAIATPAVRKAIAALVGRTPIRWIAPGQPITLDFSGTRLNVMVDDRNKIAAMRCG
jgi:hypothetical protein